MAVIDREVTISIGGSTGLVYISQYPPAQSYTYVNATSEIYPPGTYRPFYATDPTKSLVGGSAFQTWASNGIAPQRFHIDLGAAKIITRVYYENHHEAGLYPDAGVKNFTLWGSNSATAFADLTYGDDTDWTQLTTDVSAFLEHVALNVPDPQYINVTNSTAYRYYAFKFADNYGNPGTMAVRRIELQARPISSTIYRTVPIRIGRFYSTTNFLIGGTPTASNSYPGFPPSQACDGDPLTNWISANGDLFPYWWKYDLGAGVAKAAVKVKIYGATVWGIDEWSFEGSNDDVAWTTLYTGGVLVDGWQEFTFINTIKYRYYKFNIIHDTRLFPNNEAGAGEIQAFENTLIQITDVTNYRPVNIEIVEIPQTLRKDIYRPATVNFTEDSHGAIPFNSPGKAFDNIIDVTHRWASSWPFSQSIPEWLKQDFGAGNEKKIAKYTLNNGGVSNGVIKDWTFEGSNDDTNWDVLDTRTGQNPVNYTAYTFSNSTAYRYYRIVVTAINSGDAATIWEMEMMELL